MEKKQLIFELKRIRSALNERKKKLNEKYDLSFTFNPYEKFMTYIPIRPEEPTKPKEPSVPENEKDRFLKEEQLPSFENYKTKNNSLTKFEFEGWKYGVTIAGGIIGVLTIIIGGMVIGEGKSDLKYAHEWYNNIMNQSQLYNEYLNKISRAEEAIGTGVGVLIVGLCITFIPAIISLIAAFISYKSRKKKDAANLLTNYSKNEAKLIASNDEKYKKKIKALQDYKDYEKRVALYNEKLKEYNENLKEYKLKLNKYEDEYNEQLAIAKNKVASHDQKIESLAESNFNKSMSEIILEFPEKYYYAIDEIIEILEDFRADNLKEAINVLKEDEHKRKVLNEQRRLVDLQQEYNDELERQGIEQARFQEEQENYQRELMKEERRRYDQQVSFQREQVRKQEELEKRRYDQQLAFQREQESRQREQERKEKERINQIRNRCHMCASRYTCSIKTAITSVCPNFRSK